MPKEKKAEVAGCHYEISFSGEEESNQQTILYPKSNLVYFKIKQSWVGYKTEVNSFHKKLVLMIRLTLHHVKKLMDIEFAMGLMVPYSVNKTYFGKGRSRFDPDFRHVYANVIMQKD